MKPLLNLQDERICTVKIIYVNMHVPIDCHMLALCDIKSILSV